MINGSRGPPSIHSVDMVSGEQYRYALANFVSTS